MATANKGSKAKMGSIRFAETTTSRSVESSQSHVHFDEKLHDSVVMVSQEADGNFLVKIGFLKIMHKYEITFTLPPLPRLGRDVCPVPIPNLHLKVLSVTPASEGDHANISWTLDTPCMADPAPLLNGRFLEVPEAAFLYPTGCGKDATLQVSTADVFRDLGFCVKCEYIAHKEGVFKEELVLASETSDSATVRVVLQARVMDRHHGTPMLLDGVRCVGAELEYDSEHSDWRGFD